MIYTCQITITLMMVGEHNDISSLFTNYLLLSNHHCSYNGREHNDISKLCVIYLHVFFLSVSDGRDHNDVTEYKFNIRLLPVNNLPPSFSTPKTIVKVTQGGVVPIGRSVVTVNDPDTPTNDIVLTLAEAPQAGQFEKIFKNSKIVLRKGKSIRLVINDFCLFLKIKCS